MGKSFVDETRPTEDVITYTEGDKIDSFLVKKYPEPPEVPEPQVVPQTPLVTISLKIGDKTYESKGATVLEALSSLKRPEKIMLKGLLTLSQGEKSLTRMFFPVRLKRLFYNRRFQEIQAKYLQIGMKPV